MKEYIEREAAVTVCSNQYKECLRKSDWCGDTVAWNICFNIKSIPAADVVERKRGEWEKSAEGYRICNRCKSDVAIFSGHKNFCPNCGADMRGEKNAVD